MRVKLLRSERGCKLARTGLRWLWSARRHLAFMPAALVLAAYWAGGEAALIITVAIAIPGDLPVSTWAVSLQLSNSRRVPAARQLLPACLQRDGFDELGGAHIREKTLAYGNRHLGGVPYRAGRLCSS